MLNNLPTLSIIIVTHNAERLISPLFDTLNKAISFLNEKTEVIIVDNASTDKTLELIKKKSPDVILVKNKLNQGYAKAVNQGLLLAKGRFLLLLNSDTVLRKDVLKKMIDYLEKKAEVGALTCKVLLPNGEIDPACHRGFPTPWASITYFLGLERLFPKIPLFSGYHLWYRPSNKIHEIDSPSGAFFLIRREVIESIGKLDELFFMYGEDLDLAFRIKNSGWKIIYNPTSSITHFKKQSGLKSEDLGTRERTIRAFYHAMKVFYDKHYKEKYPLVLRFIIFVIIDLMQSLELIKLKRLWT